MPLQTAESISSASSEDGDGTMAMRLAFIQLRPILITKKMSLGFCYLLFEKMTSTKIRMWVEKCYWLL